MKNGLPDPLEILFRKESAPMRKERETKERISNAERHAPIPFAHKQAIRYRWNSSPFVTTDGAW